MTHAFARWKAVLAVLSVVAALALLSPAINLLKEGAGKTPRFGSLTKDASNPVLGLGPEGGWDSGSIHSPSVVRVGEGYMMLYDGTSGSDPYVGWSIGMALSEDGVSWVKHPGNPILTVGPTGEWDSLSVHDPRGLYDGRNYRMWYSGLDGERWRIGSAASVDGANWIKEAGNPLLGPGSMGEWDESGVAYSSVILDDGSYKMWYQGVDRHGVWRIGYATSSDGISWRKHPFNPVLTLGDAGSWDEQKVLAPQVARVGGWYALWYTGAPLWGIGYATSKDGIAWSKHPSNPVLKPDISEGWDKGQAMTVATLIEDGALNLWYAGGSDGRLRIGHALSRVH